MDKEDAIKSLNKFIKNFEKVQEIYKDDEIQAEIERQCYFEEVPYQEIKTLLAELKRQEKEWFDIYNERVGDIINLQNEIEELKEKIAKQEKIINAMIKDIFYTKQMDSICKNQKCKPLDKIRTCRECIAEYYEKKVEESDE